MLTYLTDNDVPEVEWLTARNLARQYDFMNTAFGLWQMQNKPSISLPFICELNFYAAHLLSPFPGQFRHECLQNVDISGTPHSPPEHNHVEGLLDDFLRNLLRLYDEDDPMRVAAYVIWRLNWIHPFVQGNGRTSRALCYFVICTRFNIWLPGRPLTELIRQNRQEYCELLRDTDQTLDDQNMADLAPIQDFLTRLLREQIASVNDS